MRSFVFAIFSALSVLFYVYVTFGPSRLWIVGGCAALTLAEFLIWVTFTSKERVGGWFHPVVFFMLTFLIVYYQVPLALVLGQEEGFGGGGFASIIWYPGYVNQGAVLSFMASSFFLFGYFLIADLRIRRVNNGALSAQSNSYSPERLKMVFWRLLAVCWLTYVAFLVVVGPRFLGGEYAGSRNWGAGATYLFLVFTILNTILACIEGRRISLFNPAGVFDYLRIINRHFLFYICIAYFPFVLAGDRGAYMHASILVLAPYFVLVRPMRFKYLLILGGCAILFLSCVGVFRSDDSTERLGDRVDRVKDNLRTLSFRLDSLPTRELAGSYRCYNCAIYIRENDEMPDDYYVGQFHACQLQGLIPFSRQFLVLRDLSSVSASTFLTDRLSHGRPVSGCGSVSLASPYLDFRAVGVAAEMLLFGAWLSYLASQLSISRQPSLLLLYVYLLELSRSYLVNRSDLLFGVKGVIWGAVLVVILSDMILGRTNRRSSLPQDV